MLDVSLFSTDVSKLETQTQDCMKLPYRQKQPANVGSRRLGRLKNEMPEPRVHRSEKVAQAQVWRLQEGRRAFDLPPTPTPHFTQSQQNMHALPAHSGRLSAGWNGLVSQMFWEGKRVPVKNVNALSRVFADLFYRPQRNSHGMFFHPSALFLGPNPSRPRSPAYPYFSGLRV